MSGRADGRRAGRRATIAAAITITTIAVVAAEAGAGGVVLDTITPQTQRVHELVTLRGQGFGTYDPALSRVVFTDGRTSIEAGTPYVWRDDFIQVRVPVGQRIDGVRTLIPPTPLEVLVVATGGTSAGVPFQVLTVVNGTLRFVERTRIEDDEDISTFLGSPNLNMTRTKDAEVGDANGDGLPDLVDNNSNNVTNGTHGVLRTNLGGGSFAAIDLEPVVPEDQGVFATTILPGGDYMEDKTTYDSDLADLNNDGLPELIQTTAQGPGPHRLRLLVNNHGGTAGMFLEDSATWLPPGTLPGCPDDIAHADLNHDGWVDVATALRALGICGNSTSQVLIFMNDGGRTFLDPPLATVAPPNTSTHDVFFIDANADGHLDVMMVNENAPVCEIFLNSGGASPTFTAGPSVPVGGVAGEDADFNGDGVPDFALAGFAGVTVFLNDPDAPGSFTGGVLPGGPGLIYDLEPGDVNLDGAVDLVGASITLDGGDSIRIWLNDGDGSFTNATGSDAAGVLPGIGDYQRLSADLVDFDVDGDLDLYISGADVQDVGQGPGFGRVPNQFWESRLYCPSDVNQDGRVNVDDLVAVILAWGPGRDCPPLVAEDVDRDCEVSVDDLVAVVLAWGDCG